MSSSFSLCSVYQRENSRDILRHLAPLLAPISRARFEDLDWAPVHEERRQLNIGVMGTDAYGIAGLELDTDHFEDENLFSISFEIDVETSWSASLSPQHAIQVNGKLYVGLFWLSVQAGDKYVLLRLEATRGLEFVLKEPDVLQMWRDYAQRSGAVLAFLHAYDSKEDYSHDDTLFPPDSKALFPEPKTLTFQDSKRFSVDHYVNFALAIVRRYSKSCS